MRKIRRFGALLTATVSVAALSQAVAPLTTGAVAASQDSSAPVLTDLRLPPAAAAPTTVTAVVFPPVPDDMQVGDTFMLREIPVALTPGPGGAQVRLDPRSVPVSLRRANGLVDFTLYVRDEAGKTWSTSLTARGAVLDPPAGTSARQAPSSSEPAWFSPIETERVSREMSAAGYPRLSQPTAPQPARSERAFASTTSADYDNEEVDVNPWEYVEVDTALTTGGSSCLETTYNGDQNISTTVGTTYPIGSTTAKMVHTNSSSNESTLGIAVGAETSGGSVSWQQGGVRTVGGSWELDWQPNGNARSYRILVNYHRFTHGSAACDRKQYSRRPHIEIGGGGTNTNGVTRPAWNTYCAPQPLNATFRRTNSEGTAYSYGAAVKFSTFIGIDLSGKKNYNSANRIEYYFTGSSGDRRHKLCGNNDYPSVAGKMIDRFL